MEQLNGRTAFITGGARGIGLGIARALAKEGVKLALVDLDAAALDAAREELSALVPTEVFILDVRDRQRFAELADEVESKLGPVSLVFNNAGVAGGESTSKMTYETWDWMIDINLNGVVNGVQTFMPRMIERGDGGHIVNTSSGAGLVVIGAGVMYSATKFAVVGMSEALWHGLKKFNIGVSVLCPGYVATGIVDNSVAIRAEGKGDPINKTDERRERSRHQLSGGASPDFVGDLVIDAIKGEHLYIYTDHMIEQPLLDRHKVLMSAFEPLNARLALEQAAQT
ncbi:NADP-dependent 3-hydroxy acid dehydrogenase YdfG [Antricoccus suffuscus]|uniref:NADP-dependent 3-hydroxy acid dehydrogenase YdfG n=1 Tax=Antricoccus suffuscus TaxID=1629062 RepID=A0A2T0ZTL5_9ACTN|nr:SDR family NAD(P)-dependent oxidoreductase [Antricoccus suffuscus]PRZ39699.1 NADP-dependent 3-hydroxy acid dehydrogenase YdfG [Antricoccus suffuscus]